MKRIFFFLLLLTGFRLSAQPVDSLSLLDCFKIARENSPLIQQLDHNSEIYQLQKEAISTANLPQLNAYGKAWYQSDAVAVPPMFPGAEGFTLDRFQYNFGAEINQKIYDGGLVSKLDEQEKSKLTVNNAEVESSVYQVYQQVSDAYFAILLFQENLKILDLKLQNLNERQKSLESAYQNGVVLLSELNKLKAEQLSVKQQKTDLLYSIDQLKKSLLVIMGYSPEEHLIIQQKFEIDDLVVSKRPEYLSLSAMEHQAIVSKNLLSNSLAPKLYAYGQLGYSYPGLNFFENQSDPYYIVGLKFSWNIFDWQKTKKEKAIADVQIQKIKTQEDELDQRFETASISKESDIEKYQALIRSDIDIIELKASIVKSSSSAFDNGSISFSDYIYDVNAETISRIDQNKHTIQLYKSQVDLALIKGINIE